jgi:hemerythrin
MLQWDKKYEIGIPEIDEQHQHLFVLGNQIYALLKDSLRVDKYDEIVTLIHELREYSKYHFSAEEAIMLKIKYRGYFKQKTQHDDFIAVLDSIDLNAIDNDQDKHIEKLLGVVFDWVLEHIIKDDTQITKG